MKFNILKSALIAIAVLLSAGPSWAEDSQPQKAKQTKPAAKPEASAKVSKAAAPKAVPLVDINSATKEELKKLPGIGDADADKIIAGRPYLTKAHLQTHNIVSPGVYQALRQLVVARQKESTPAKAIKK